ncbi:mevalonate kinase [Limosilactobacillus sp.]|jgi:mevalonate kinase|uniref:mevalonate kinase n=1 Tax=Limosilactobacillus sp. TaxID=2773925 RepID=UPI0025C1F4C2|nr:mevalonate kinase [Limosilactobacillus sp.]MCH3922944.1 mevalonate kinase [Limosilactobacillus sp.]MCH3927627.1 mevalonate kinase [Limosilactobacillus sp.]
MVKQQGIGHSCAKIILMGDHSVVYGQPAIALPLPSVGLTVTITSTTAGQTVESRYYTGDWDALPEEMAGVSKLIATLVDRFGGQNDHWHLTIESQLPAERGMGSSAATAIAIVRAFFDYYEQPLDRPTLLQLADVEEQITHRSPSGLDAATASSKTPLYYIKGQAGTSIPLNLQATMVIADTGIKGATKEAILGVQELLKNDPANAQAHIEHLGELVKATRGFLANNEVNKLGTALNAAQEDLRALQVSDDHLDHLIEVAIANGALGAKLTGGGRGGCMFAITRTALGARKLASILKENGARQTWIQPLDTRGEQ